MTMRWTPLPVLPVLITGVAVSLLSTRVALAQGPVDKSPGAPQQAPAPAPGSNGNNGAQSVDKMGEAKVHYDRGLQLYEEGAYDGARVEFERAYELAPTYRILYNIGLVQKQQSDYAGALKSLEAYIEEGSSQVPDARRAELVKEIAALRARTATVTISTNVPDADVFVDDVPVGKSPFKQFVRVNPGRRKISAVKPGRLPATKVIEVAGSDRATVALELAEARAVFVVEKPTRRVPWLGWIATGAFAVGAGVMAYYAIDADSKLKDARDRLDANPNDLSSRQDTVRTLSILADACAGAAVIAGGISLYYTIKWNREDSQRERALARQSPSGPRLQFGPRPMVDRMGNPSVGFGAIGAF